MLSDFYDKKKGIISTYQKKIGGHSIESVWYK